MALKTDYKDDVFSGDRKYQEKDNSDGTISLVDKTAYSQKGDTFSAADINAINKAVNELSAVATTATWDNVTGKPDAYPTTWENVTGKPEATTSTAGLMSAEDKTVLDELNNNGPNVLHSYVNRPASANDITGDDSKLKWFLASSDMTEGKPSGEGYIIQFSWLKANWPSQLFIPSYGVKASLQFRKYNLISGKWSKWFNVYSEEIPQSSTTKSLTLSASSWSSGSYTISDSLITAMSNQEILPATSITADQMKALQKANIIDSGQSAGSLTLKALGTVPSIDIPIRIIFRGTI